MPASTSRPSLGLDSLKRSAEGFLLAPGAPPDVRGESIGQQAMQIGFNEIFHLLGIIFLAVIALVWIARPPFAAKAGAPAGGGH